MPRLQVAGEGKAEAKAAIVCALIAVLDPPVRQIDELSARIRNAVAELGDDRTRHRTADQLTADTGFCPVTHQSGKSCSVEFGWACNRRLRAAIARFVDNSHHASQLTPDGFDRARTRRCEWHAGGGILGRAMARILWRAWAEKTHYHPTRHRALSATG